MKNILVLLVCLMMVTKGLAYDFVVDGIYYNKTSTYSEVEVTYASSKFNSYSGKITIPGSVKYGGISYSVTLIGKNAFKNCTNLTSVTLGENISGGYVSFSGCTALKEFFVSNGNTSYSMVDGVLFTFDMTQIVAYPNAKSATTYVIPDGVETVGLSAFEKCLNLTSITIPNSLKMVNQNCFNGCTGLGQFVVSYDNSLYSTIEGVLFDKEKTKLLAYPNAKSVSYVIPENTEDIQSNAFHDCIDLVSITIPNSIITQLSNLYFKNCISLKEFVVFSDNLLYSTIDGVLYNKNATKLLAYPNAISSMYVVPDGVTSIGDFSFANCVGLTSVVVPDGVKNIGESIFEGCRNLQKFSLPFIGSSFSGKRHLGYLFESKSDFKEVEPKEGYVVITHDRDGSWIYSYCIPLSLTEVTLTKQLDISCRYGGYNNDWKFGVFNGCTNLKVVKLPVVTSLGENAFLNCTNLKDISLPTATLVVNNAFSGCTNLKDVNLPVAKIIDDEAFWGCKSLVTLNMPLVTSIGDKVFSGCTNLKNIEFPKLLTVGSGSFEQCSNLEYLNLPVATSIVQSSFYKCDKLKTLLLPKVKNTGYFTYPSTLLSLNIGSLEELKSGILSSCSQLEELTIPFVGIGNKSTATGVNGLLGKLFSTSANSEMRSVIQYYAEGKSETFYFPVNLRKVTVTEECEEIQYGAFYGCSTIKELTLPYTLYMMGEKALFGCAGLTDIYCKGAAPAAAYDNSFTGVRTTTCKLHIPYHTADLYKASDGWNKFFYMQEEAPLTVNVTKNILNAGIILGITEYQQGALAELSARANSGYHFKYWMDSDVIVSEEENYSFVVNDDKKLMAVFVPVLNDNSLVITAESNAVNFIWETVDDTEGYILKIYSDAEMTKEIASYTFDTQGELVTRAGTSFFYRAADLKPESVYSYSLTANDKYNNVLSQQIGTFSTLATGIDNTSGDMDIRLNVGRQSVQVENADGKTIVIYDLQGICRAIIHKAENMESIQLQHSGIYLVRIGTFSQKIIVK